MEILSKDVFCASLPKPMFGEVLSLKLALVGGFTPQTQANITDELLFFPFLGSSFYKALHYTLLCEVDVVQEAWL